MNPLHRTLIENAGNDNGFEHVVASDTSVVTLASARHANRVLIGLEGSAYHVHFETGSPSLLPELRRSFPAMQLADAFRITTAPDLAGIDLQPVGISLGMKLRWVNALHQPYLGMHRARLLVEVITGRLR
jgi:putative restriction endonuclease